MAAANNEPFPATNQPPTPPLTHWWNPPSHEGLLDTDIEHVTNVSFDELDDILWKTHSHYKAMVTYIHTCLACRASARRMGLPYGSKEEWWEFVYQFDIYLSRVESRLMYCLEEMVRRHFPKRKKNKAKASSRPLKKRRVE